MVSENTSADNTRSDFSPSDISSENENPRGPEGQGLVQGQETNLAPGRSSVPAPEPNSQCPLSVNRADPNEASDPPHDETTASGTFQQWDPGPRRGEEPLAQPLESPQANIDQAQLRLDAREQLVNAGEIGAIHMVSIPARMVTSVRAILFDIDPHLLRDDLLPDGSILCPDRLYSDLVRFWLSSNPVLANAEVRCSGRGLHVIVWFSPKVELKSEAERSRWAATIKIVQHILPTDPNAPGITALTRPVGSINPKNGAQVRVLCPGQTVSEAEVLELFESLKTKPFRTVCSTLFGSGQLHLCPKCKNPERTFAVGDRVGTCYGCGKVKLEQVYDYFFAKRTEQHKEGSNG